MFDASKAVKIDQLSKKAVGKKLSEESIAIGDWLKATLENGTGKAAYKSDSEEEATKLAQKVTSNGKRIGLKTAIRFNSEDRSVLEVSVSVPVVETEKVELQEVTEDVEVTDVEEVIEVEVKAKKPLGQSGILANARKK